MNYEFNISAVFYFLFLISGLIFGFILVFKYFIKRSNKSIFQYRSSFLLLGFIVSLAFVFIVFNITIAQNRDFSIPVDMVVDIIDIDIPRTVPPVKKEIPKLPPPVIETVPDDDIIDEQPEFLSTETNPEESIELFNEDPVEMDDNNLPPPVENKKDDIPFFIVEQMPRFPGCEGLATNAERDKCAQEKLLQYIYSNLEYPVIARENGIEGRVVIRFVVEKSGKIANVEIVRDPGGGCGTAAAKIIEMMNDLPQRWTPGRQGGRKVSVYYTLPVVYELKK